MAGFTHSAFRRLLTDLGGCGAVWTEMLAARQLLKEDFASSPWLRRRPGDGPLMFQLMVRAGDPLDRILPRLADQGVDAVDLNLACDAFTIRACEAGSALFENLDHLRTVAETARRHWTGLLTAKIRLGSRHPDWRTRFAQRVNLLTCAGFDALVLHPRFFEDKFRRAARHELLAWTASLTPIPLIANGDLTGPATVAARHRELEPACAIMIGRMAIAQPWIFAHWNRPQPIDLPVTWRRLHDYVLDDFPPATALRRLQMFSRYFAANFAFGHRFAVSLANAPTLESLRQRAEAFFAQSPATLAHPVVAGL
jgi:tRNA-dihydrouridine synthase